MAEIKTKGAKPKKGHKPISSKLMALGVGDSIVYSYTQRRSVEQTRARIQVDHPGIKFSISTIDIHSFRISKTA